MAASLGNVLAQLQRWASPSLAELSDSVLLERFLHRRDESAFAALVARHGEMVLRSCRRVLGDAHEAEDAFQATFLILARKAHTLRQPAALPGYLHSVARRVALKARRSGKRPACRATGEPPDASPDPLEQLTARELLTVFDEEVARLPTAQRSAVVLCCLEGHTRDEAARLLGCPLGSLKGHLERGRKLLQARLRRRGIALSAVLTLVTVSRGEAVSALLRQGAVQAALHGGIGSSAAALAHGVLQTMFLSKLAAVTVVVLTIVLAAASTIAVVHRGPSEVPENEERGRPAHHDSGRDVRAPAPRTDTLGDPLPPGAIARLGTVRFRHGSRIDRMVFSADGKQLIAKSAKEVRIWDVATGKELRQLIPPGVNWTGGTGLSPDGERLAVIHRSDGVIDSGVIDLWDVRSGKKIDSFGKGDYFAACLSPDGKLVAVCDQSGNVELWDLPRRVKLRSWKAQKWQIWSFMFSADSRRLLTCGTDSNLRLWDVATGRQLQEFGVPDYSAQSNTSLPLSPDGKLIAVIEKEKQTQPGGAIRGSSRISIWDTATGKQIQQLPPESAKGDKTRFVGLTFTEDSKRLLASEYSGILRIWDPRTGKELRKIPCDPRGANALALSKDGKTLAAGSGMSIHLLDLPSGKAHEPPEGRAIASAHMYGTAFAPDGKTAVSSSWDNELLLWDAETGRVRQRLGNHHNFLLSRQMSRDGKTLYSCDAKKMLRIWDLSRGAERSSVQLNSLQGMPRYSAVSPDNRSLFIADYEGAIAHLDAATGKERCHIQGPKYLYGIACRPDGRSVVGWCGDRKIRIWDAASGRLQHEYTVPEAIKGANTIPGPNGAPATGDYPAALSPDGRLLAMGSYLENDDPKHKDQYTLILKDLSTGRDITFRDPLPSRPEPLVFSPDGRMLAWSSIGMDDSIHLMEVASGRERRRMIGHRGNVNTLQFSATGDRLLSESYDTTALVWDLGIDRARGWATAAELDALWADLAGDDAPRAYRAIKRFAAALGALTQPRSPGAIAFLRKHLRPVPAVDEKRLASLIADLDSDNFGTRQKASEELSALDERAIVAYRKALASKPPLEQRRRLDDLLEKAQRVWWSASGERLRMLRAIEVLELAGTSEARELLATLAAGADGVRLTEEAKSARHRLGG